MALIEKELLEHYGTTDANTIKLKIIWLHIQALMNAQYPCEKPGTREHAEMEKYKRHWQWCEKKSPE